MLIATCFFKCTKPHIKGQGGAEEGQEGMEQVEGGGGSRERKKEQSILLLKSIVHNVS